MSAPSWAILVPTIPRRAALFVRLMDRLLPQTPVLRTFGSRLRSMPGGDTAGNVSVLAWLNEGTPRLAEIRDEMLRHADEVLEADYISFIDDDDMVPDYYVRRVLDALESEPDHVGFPIDYQKDGRPHWPCDHSLRHRRWDLREGQLVRDFTHIDPMRTIIARRGRFAAASEYQPEDRSWVRQVRPWLRNASEVYIPEIMYHYYWAPAMSAWDRTQDLGQGHRPPISQPNLLWHPESL